MSEFEEYLLSISPEAYDCVHPDKEKKGFGPEKVLRICQRVARGKPCPFLIMPAASIDREDESPTILIRRNTQRFPGE